MSVGIGVIGAGIMGSDHARSIARSVKGADLIGIYDVDPTRAAAATSEVENCRIHASAKSLIEDPRIDAVVIASPDPTHEELVLACLSCQKPVLCEKPLAPTIEGCRRILAAESALGKRLVQVGFMRRFDPSYLELKSALARGEIGTPRLLRCIHRNASVPPSFDSGMLISNSAVHEIDIARWLLDEEISFATVFAPLPSPHDTLRDPQFLVLEMQSGVLVDVEVFVRAGYGYDVRAEIVGDAGTVSLSRQESVRLRSSGREASNFAPDWRAHFRAAYLNQLQAWVDLLLGKALPCGATAWDGYAATATAQACLAALRDKVRTRIELDARPGLYE